MPAIDPELIPGANLDPDAVDDAARSLRADALAVRDAGVDVVGAWYGLRADYQAPEADRLLSALDPVRSDTATLGDDLEQVATALGRFAQDLRAIKSAFDVVRADAWTFHARIATNPEWEFDPELVAQNTTLLGRVNSVQVQLWDAERECANAIRAIDCLAPWNAGVSDGPADSNTFGLTEIPTETAMPWGAPVEQKEHCPASAVTSVRSAVWDGFAKDVVGEGFLGLGGLIGLDEHGFSTETFTATWGGMGALIGRDPASGQWSWGTAGDAWLETGKSLVAWDMWEEDPARAFGTAAGNILLAVATLGTGAAIKGVATAGRTGQVLSATMQGARILGNAMDPIAVLRGGTALVSTTRAAGVTAGLSAGLRSLSQIEVPAVTQLSNVPEPAAMKGNDIPARMETPSVEKYTTDNGHLSSVNHVREPVTVGAAQGTYGPEGSFGTGGDTVIDGGNGQPYGGLPDGDVSGGHVPDGGMADGGMPDGDVPDGDAPGGDRPDEGTDWDGGDRDADDPDAAGPGDEPATGSSDHDESGSGSDGGDRSGLGDDPIAWENPDEGVSLTESQKAAADEYLATSRQIEPRITQDMQDLAAEHPGARLEGLDYRLKSEDSFYRKLATSILNTPTSVDDLLAKMKDSVRFTFVVEPGDYVRSTQAIIDDLSERGYEPFGTLKNTWDQPGYQGINSNWVDQSGRIIEVQFHTPDSFDAKMSSHSQYEEIRAPGTTPDRAAELRRVQNEIFDNVPRPEHAAEIRWPGDYDVSDSHDLIGQANDPHDTLAASNDPHGASNTPDDGRPDDGSAATQATGGHFGPKIEYLRDGWASDAYDEIIQSTDDVHQIAANEANLELPDGSTITENDIGAIKEHVFLTEHELTYPDGETVVQRFDPDADQAEAWFRLQDGTGTDLDRLWLLHEKTEMQYMGDNPGSTYHEAHAVANEVANWALELKKRGLR
jgi:hypothetical protein